MKTKIQVKFLKYSSMIILLFIFFFSSHVVSSQDPEDYLKKHKMEKMYESYKQEAFPDILSITVEQFLQWQKREKIVLVDVRKPEEREVSMIPSAIPVEEFEKHLDEYKNHKIIYYCTIGYRSGLHTKEAQQKNLNAYNLRGGVLAWAHARQTFVDSEGESLDVHVYGRKWNLTPQGYNPVW